jgi:hypothetical protein
MADKAMPRYFAHWVYNNRHSDFKREFDEVLNIYPSCKPLHVLKFPSSQYHGAYDVMIVFEREAKRG